MKNIFSYMTLVALLFAATGCLDDMRSGEINDISAQIEVKLVLPENIAEGVSVEGLTVTVSNASKTRGITYEALTDVEGVARLSVEKGIYSVGCQIELPDGGMLMGGEDNMDATKGVVAATTIDLIRAFHVGKMIIKEAYFSGCKNDNNGNYSSDQYVIIYNNSDEVQYLDGMGLAPTADMGVLTAASAWTPVFNQGMVALYQVTFSFPTDETGKRFPLEPGEEAVVCVNAVSHLGVASASVDLGKAGYFALFHTDFKTQSVPDSERGVITMDIISISQPANYYIIHTTTPAFVLYKIEGMTPLEYAAQPGSVIYKPGTSTGAQCLIIDKRWVLDGIEFGNSGVKAARLPVEVNQGVSGIPTTNTAIGSGEAWHRKVKRVVDGRIIYVDTNNTAADFVTGPPSLKE